MRRIARKPARPIAHRPLSSWMQIFLQNMQRRRSYTHLYFPLRPTLFSTSRESFRYVCDYGYCIILGRSCHAVVHSGTLSSFQFANMEEPKPKRLTTDEVKTVLFLIHHHSWKATVMLPTRHVFSLQEVEKALKKENLPVPIFPEGEFEVVRLDLTKLFQVAIFKHHRNGVVGCRKTDSKQHKILPFSTKCHKNITEFIRQPNNLRVGFRFLWGIEQPYTVDEGKVLLEVQFSPTCVPEAQRTSILTGFLRLHYGNENYTITASSGRNSIRYCQFSGGGILRFPKIPPKAFLLYCW